MTNKNQLFFEDLLVGAFSQAGGSELSNKIPTTNLGHFGGDSQKQTGQNMSRIELFQCRKLGSVV